MTLTLSSLTNSEPATTLTVLSFSLSCSLSALIPPILQVGYVDISTADLYAREPATYMLIYVTFIMTTPHES
jgi:hypothetical protein